METGLDPKARRKAAKKPGKPPAAKRSRQDEDEEDDDDDDDDDEDPFSRDRGRGKSKPKETLTPMVFSSDDENDDVDVENGAEDEENGGEDDEDEMLREVEDGVDEESGSRPALQIGARVKLRIGHLFWASHQNDLEFLYEDLTTGCKSKDVHGIVRGAGRRGLWRVQWFSKDAKQQLFDMPPDRIYTLLSDEWSKDTETKFRPIQGVRYCYFSLSHSR